MAKATTSKPTDPEPQTDRTVLVPLLNEIDQLRLDLTTVANWLFGRWPVSLGRPTWERTAGGFARLVCHASTKGELMVALEVLEADAPVGTLRRAKVGGSFPASIRRFGERVEVEVWANKNTWAQAFPGEATQ